MTFFNWDKEKDKYEHLLNHSELHIWKLYICNYVNLLIEKEECTFDPIFIQNILRLDRSTRIQTILDIGTAPMCRCQPWDTRSYLSIYNDNYDNPISLKEWTESDLYNSVYKYATPQFCHVVVLYIYHLVKLMIGKDPIIILGPDHAFVMHNGIIYDLLWYRYGLREDILFQLGNKDTKFYTDINQYIQDTLCKVSI